MAHMEKDSLSEKGASRPSLRHTPPGVWPPVAPPGGMGRLVRRLTVSALRLGEEEPGLGLLATQGAAR
jgi:hypothetical protein